MADDAVLAPEDIARYARIYDLDQIAADAGEDHREFGAAGVIQRLCASHERLREDAERWEFLREFLGVARWDLWPASQLTASLYRIPAIGRSDATVEEIVDQARKR